MQPMVTAKPAADWWLSLIFFLAAKLRLSKTMAAIPFFLGQWLIWWLKGLYTS